MNNSKLKHFKFDMSAMHISNIYTGQWIIAVELIVRTKMFRPAIIIRDILLENEIR